MRIFSLLYCTRLASNPSLQKTGIPGYNFVVRRGSQLRLYYNGSILIPGSISKTFLDYHGIDL